MEALLSTFFEFGPSIPARVFGMWELLQQAGVDAGQLMSLYFGICALYQAAHSIHQCISMVIFSHLTSYIEIDDCDPLYNHLMDWSSEHRMATFSRELKATTVQSSLPRDRDEAADDGNVDSLFDYQKWYSREPLIYKPNFSSHYFFHNGSFFHWSRSRRATMWGHGFDDVIVIRCLGRSPTPIKALLRDVKGFKSTKGLRTTEIYRSSVKAENVQWIRHLVQPSRPLQSISLDKQQKSRLVLDMDEYLDPKTARWYAARGIPYRRGMLFHGPPGTGKTSLIFALGGVFNLGIYCISLNDIGLTEGHLVTLFSSLPTRCVVLLEDVDTAGLLRDGMVPETHIAPRRSSINQIGRSLISVAGLLNVIDGAAAKEGRVLIMTTNRPEALDAALIRPGRVDHKVEFTLATRDQTASIFERMYDRDDSSETDHLDTHARPLECEDLLVKLHPRKSGMVSLSTTQVRELAQQFSRRLPEKVFSPAEIQGYLLEYKADPEGALNEVENWVAARLGEGIA